MADKYVDTTLTTGANDGSSPANAWQSLVDVLDGTPTNGSYSAGDTIHIRTAVSGWNNSETLSTSITTPTKTGAEDNPVIWKFDDGTVWPGDAGQFQLESSGGATWSLNAGNQVDGDGKNYRLVITGTNLTADSKIIYIYSGVTVNGVHFVRGNGLSGNRDLYVYFDRIDGESNVARLEKCKIDVFVTQDGTENATAANPCIDGNSGANGKIEVVDTEIVMNDKISGSFVLKSANLRAANVELIGCKFTNTKSDQKIVNDIAPQYGADVVLRNCDIGLIQPENNLPSALYKGYGVLNIENIGGKYDFARVTTAGLTKYDSSANYPYLNATLPDGTGWSILAYPSDTNCSQALPLTIGVSSKVYNQTAASKTVTLELLIKDTTAFVNPQKDQWWMEVTYTDDATGDAITETTKTTGNLATSTASWSATTYGANSYNRHKLELTTANSIKQNTLVEVRLYSSVPAINPATSANGDFYFIDPDFNIS